MGNNFSCASSPKRRSKPKAITTLQRQDLKHKTDSTDAKVRPNVAKKEIEEFVEMPYMSAKRWPDIYNGLSNLYKTFSRENFQLNQIEKTVMSYTDSTLRNASNFLNLYDVLNEMNKSEVTKLIMTIISLALKLPELMKNKKVALLKQAINKSISLTQIQCASLLANAFFCTFSESQNKNLKPFNFIRLFTKLDEPKNSIRIEKLKFFINYFKRAAESDSLQGNIKIKRQVYNKNGANILSKSKKQVKNLIILDHSRIEENLDVLEVDFANKYIGGGVLGDGCVQEEIRFLISPELCVSILFCERMNKNEAILIKGAEIFNTYEGYADIFKWKNNFVDRRLRDESNTLKTCLVAMDAYPFRQKQDQFQKELIDRDINKCFAAFFEEKNDELGTKSLPIATGHWGCGAFNGDKEIKLLIQLLVASEFDKTLLYCTFYDRSMNEYFKKLINYITSKKMAIGSVYEHLINYSVSKFNFKRLKFKEEINFHDYLSVQN